VIEIDDLRKRFAGRAVLDGVSARVARGEVVALTGPSGAGKTTLLRCLNGLDRPDAGTVRVDGQELRAGARGPDAERALLALRRKVGMVFQQWHLFQNRTVLGNVIEAPVQVAREPSARATTRARALLDRAGIAHRAGAYPHQLSGGEQQRAAIARALAMSPSVLLLDEPTSALDPERTRDLVALLRGLVADGLTLVCVTHDAGFARALGARVLVLEDGKLRAASALDELAARFAACTLPRAEWTHAAHLRMGAWQVHRHGPEEALRRLRAGIRRLNESNGVPNTPTGGYHETITAAYVQLIALYLAASPDDRPLEARVEALLGGPLADQRLLLNFWSPERLMSEPARAAWVPPDLAPLALPEALRAT
jgi:ABC-type polar amino acid transport system ATPase subunit